MRDVDIGKRMIEEIILEQFLDSLQVITGRTVTEEWEGLAEQIEGSPDFIIGLNGKPFGIELTEIIGADDAWDYVEKSYRLATKKSESYNRRNIFRFPIALIVYSSEPELFDIRDQLVESIVQSDFNGLGFSEIWAVDFSDAYYSPGHPFRLADMFCFKPADWFGFYRVGGSRKPYG